jgi:hypothetical protein
MTVTQSKLTSRPTPQVDALRKLACGDMTARRFSGARNKASLVPVGELSIRSYTLVDLLPHLSTARGVD